MIHMELRPSNVCVVPPRVHSAVVCVCCLALCAIQLCAYQSAMYTLMDTQVSVAARVSTTGWWLVYLPTLLVAC